MPFFKEAAKAKRLVLRGRIVTLSVSSSRVIAEGAVCIEGDTIRAVTAESEELPASFRDAPVVDTGGTIFPGLIELHNHLSYNYLPLWEVPRHFENRNIWRTKEDDYDVKVAWPAKLIGQNTQIDFPRSVARYVECRSLFGGVTTTQGISSSTSSGTNYYSGLLRNVESPNDPAFPSASGQTLDYEPTEIQTKLVNSLKNNRPFFYHLSEGTDFDARARFTDLQYAPNKWAIDRDLIAIHCTALRAGDFDLLVQSGGMVWSPLSNFLLYGSTANVRAAKERGVRIALGADWSPSGSKNILGELKIARIVSRALGGLFSDEELVRMVTSVAAEMLQWNGLIGTIEVGKKADLLVMEGSSGDPYAQLIQAREDQIVAVLIGGRPRLARQGLVNVDLGNAELFKVGQQMFALDLTEPGSDPLAGMSLATSVTKLKDGLARLPEIARATSKALSLMNFAEQSTAITIDLDMEDEKRSTRLAMFSGPKGIDPDLVVPLDLEPLTEVDDPTFRERLRSNINLPEFLRDAL